MHSKIEQYGTKRKRCQYKVRGEKGSKWFSTPIESDVIMNTMEITKEAEKNMGFSFEGWKISITGNEE